MTAGLTEKIKYGFTKDKDMQRMHILFLCLYRQARRMQSICGASFRVQVGACERRLYMSGIRRGAARAHVRLRQV